MPKQSNTTFSCQNCAYEWRKWLGKCPECGEWNSLVEERVVTTKKGAGRNSFRLREARAVAYSEIESQDDVRIPSGVTEFDRVLGGGIVPGTLVLLGGDPGIGKSTLLLQVADKLSANDVSVLYVSGEESERQIKLRGARLGVANSRSCRAIPFAGEESRDSRFPDRPRHERRIDCRPARARAHRGYRSLFRRRAASQSSHRAGDEESLRRRQ